MSTRLLPRLTLIALAAIVGGCGYLTPPDLRVPKVFFSDYRVTPSAKSISGTTSQSFVDNQIKSLQASKHVGLVYTPDYVFTSDPILLFKMTEPVTVAETDLVEETEVVGDKLVTQKVLRKPLFFVEKATITYQVPNFDLPAVTYELQMPIKQTFKELTFTGVTQVKPLMEAYAKDPAAAGTISGTMTVTVEGRDLDPTATERTFRIARTLPLVYTFVPVRAN